MTQQWFERQLLPPRHGISIADVVAKAGWIPSAGGTGPYLSIRARIPGINRQHVDDVVFERMEILELPSVRDTAFLVARSDAAIALAAGRRSYAERLRKLPVDASELASLGKQILKTLDDNTRTTDQLRRELLPNSIRDLGDAGKRLGITSTLTATLKLLQGEGKLLRTNAERRLDGRTHLYRRWPAEIDTTRRPISTSLSRTDSSPGPRRRQSKTSPGGPPSANAPPKKRWQRSGSTTSPSPRAAPTTP
jgi:hypothetical protein